MKLSKEEWLKLNKRENESENQLLELAYTTLMGNLYSDGSYPWSPYRCISPVKVVFPGIWNWDSAFHSVGVSEWDTELAREGLLGFMQFQKKSGLFPDVIYETGEMADTFSKPPVFARACETVYKKEKDLDFLKKVYPMLAKNADYLEKQRCFDGLFFYGCEDSENDENYELLVKFESGWDNAVRWDKTITDLWPVDLNSFMVMTYRSLNFIANELSLKDDAAKWLKKAETLSALINQYLWDEKRKTYADTNKITKEASDVLSPAIFMPLYIGIADTEQALCMEKIAKVNFKSKMPTVSFDNPEYSNIYWRGPTWLNVAYFAAKGLKNYGFDVADKIKSSILKTCAQNPGHIYENYDSISGKGLYCDHFSWSSVFIVEFILNF